MSDNILKFSQFNDHLLSCPFCGGPAEYDSRHYSGKSDNNHLHIVGHAVYCADVDCVGCPSFSRVYETREEAFQAWNTRPKKAVSLATIEVNRYSAAMDKLSKFSLHYDLDDPDEYDRDYRSGWEDAFDKFHEKVCTVWDEAQSGTD